MKFKLFTFAYENNGIWKNSILAEKIATLHYLKNGFTEDEILNFHVEDIQELCEKYPEHFTKTPWMYGFFLWKPYLFLKLMNIIDYDDILIYSDIGSLTTGKIKETLTKFLREEDMFFWKESIPMYKDCKRDLFYYFKVDYEKYKDYPLFRGCFWAYKKTERTVFYMQKIFENMCKMENVDHEIRIENNPEGFVVNHPCQSVPTLTLINLGFDYIKFYNNMEKFLNENRDIELLIHVCRSIRSFSGFEEACTKLNFSESEKEYLSQFYINYV